MSALVQRYIDETAKILRLRARNAATDRDEDLFIKQCDELWARMNDVEQVLTKIELTELLERIDP